MAKRPKKSKANFVVTNPRKKATVTSKLTKEHGTSTLTSPETVRRANMRNDPNPISRAAKRSGSKRKSDTKSGSGVTKHRVKNFDKLRWKKNTTKKKR